MKGAEQRDRVLLDEMLRHLEVIAHVADFGKADVTASRTLRYALEHAIELLSEAAEKVSREFRSANSGVPWARFRAVRRALAHPYDVGAESVSLNEVWTFATKLAPQIWRRLRSPRFPAYDPS